MTEEFVAPFPAERTAWQGAEAENTTALCGAG